MKSLPRALILVPALLLMAALAHADDYSDTINIFRNAGESSSFFHRSYGYAVFPTVGEGGLGVGGAFDYLTGRVPRAPAWMRKAGFEWSYRLVNQPWRVRRMAVLPVYALKVLSAGK